MMLLSAKWFHSPDDPDIRVAALAIIALAAVGIWRFFKWVNSSPVTPDPWDNEVATALESENAVPLCANCLEPHGENEHLCTHCGAPVGPCTGLMPPLFYFGLGQILRTGTSGVFRTSTFYVVGYFFLAFTVYALPGVAVPMAFLIPLYWGRLILNVARLREGPSDGSSGGDDAGGSAPAPPPGANLA